MSKLKLDLERLRVESFQPEAQKARRGTVAAHEDAGPTSHTDPCFTDVSVCYQCFYTANPCECTTLTSG